MPRDFSKIPPHMMIHIIITRGELGLFVPYSMVHIYRLMAMSL